MQRKRIRLRTHEAAGLIPGLAQWVKHPALLWLWCWPAAVALIRPLAWEPPYAPSVALKSKKKKKKKSTTLAFSDCVLASRPSLKLIRTMDRNIWILEDNRQSEDVYNLILERRGRNFVGWGRKDKNSECIQGWEDVVSRESLWKNFRVEFPSWLSG